MTQSGRYAHIAKLHLTSARIAQTNGFTITGSALDGTETAAAEPVDTHVFLEADEPDEVAAKMVRMGEQTCFLHAAMRGSHPSRIRVTLNSENLDEG
jgi:hypothetical protein